MGVVYPPDLRQLSPSHLLDAVEKLIDGTDTTSGASESALAERRRWSSEQLGLTGQPKEPPAGVEPATY